MPTMPERLLQYLMELLGNPAAAEAFTANPEKALQDNDLGGVCSDDVDAIRPVLVDFAPVAFEGSFDREYNTGGNTSSAGAGDRGGHDDDRDPDKWHHDDDDKWHHDDDHGHAVQQLINIVNEYSSIDDRDTILDQSVNQQIYAKGDVQQLFMNEAVLASGDGALAAGDDIDASTDSSVNAGDDAYVGNEDSFNEDSYNTDDSFNEDSYNEDSYNEDSYNEEDSSVTADRGGQVGDNTEIELENVGNDYSDNSTDNSVTVDDGSQIGDNTDNSVTADDGGQVGDNTTVIRDNFSDNEFEDNDQTTTTTTTTEDNDTVVEDNDTAVNVEDNELFSDNTYEDNDSTTVEDYDTAVVAGDDAELDA